MASTPLWITYAWKDDEEGDFSYLVQELRAIGVEAIYDKIALVPGRRLWQQIGNKILNSPLSGWAYLLTPFSITREACREELEYALNRAINSKGADFPLIGLLHNIAVEDVPAPLRIRLCVNLASPTWTEEVAAAVEARPPRVEPTRESRFVWNVHMGYLGRSEYVAVEVRPRFGSEMYWRFVVPDSSKVVTWGHGPAGGGMILGMRQLSVDGTADFQGRACRWFGSGDALSPSVSAYAVFEGILPEFIGFGVAKDPLALPPEFELASFKS